MKIDISNLSVLFDDQIILDDISCHFPEGKFSCLVGENGSGKTPTAKMVLNILKTDEGSVIRNTNNMAYVPQKINIDWTLP